MRRIDTRAVAEIGLAVALATVLNMPFFRLTLPFNIAGGTVSLNMLPLFIVAMRRGVGPGVLAGMLYGVVDALIDPFVVHPAQFLLDYPLAYGMTGLAGFATRFTRSVDGRSSVRWPILIPALLLAVGGRFVCHWVAGVVFFGSYAPEGQPVWLYSLVYNAAYLLPSFALTAAAALVVLPVVNRAVPVQRGREAG